MMKDTVPLSISCAIVILLLTIVPLPTKAAKVVALGDSYTAGTGYHVDPFAYDESWGGTQVDFEGVHYVFTTSGLPFKGCFREIDKSPTGRYAQQQDQEFVMVACRGAEIENFIDQIHYLNAKYPEERAINWRGSTILLTIGLNDLKSQSGDEWGVVLIDCILRHPIQDCSTNPGNKVGNLAVVQTDLTDAFQLLVSEASEATIRILGYGELFQRGNSDCHSFGITNGAADLFDHDYFAALNAVLEETVDYAKTNTPVGPALTVDMEFVDVTSYLTIGSCSKDQDMIDLWGLLFVPTVACFHPTPLGYDKYYQAIVDNLAANNIKRLR